MNKKVCYLFGLFLFFLIGSFVFSEEAILIKNGRIVPVVGKVLPEGSVLIDGGKIVKIGLDIVAPPTARIIDAKGMLVYPGFIAPMTAIGVTGYPGAGNDINEVGVATPQMDPYDAVNPEDDCIQVARLGGVTTVMTISGTQNVIDGKAIVINLEGDLAEDMVVKRDVAMIFNIGARRQNAYPSTLPGITAFIRKKFNQVKIYMEKKENPGKEDKEKNNFSIDLEMEALIPVLKKKIPALFVTSDNVTIRNALEIIKEYNLRGIIYARPGILRYVDRLASEKIPLIWAGTMTVPKQWQPFDLNYHTASVISARGVLFAFDQAGWGPGNRNVRNLTVPASMSVAHGLSEEEAIKAMTIYPARILGIDDSLGSLEEGKMANVVIWKGSPIQMKSRVEMVIIKGKIIPMTSIQTRLRDKYEKIVRERMRKKK